MEVLGHGGDIVCVAINDLEVSVGKMVVSFQGTRQREVVHL